MAKDPQIEEFKLTQEIGKLLKKGGVPVPRQDRINRRIKKAKDREPHAFGVGVPSSLERIAKDIADDIRDRHDKLKQGKGERRPAERKQSAYPLGYEYLIVAASRLKPYVERLRNALWNSKEIPFKDYSSGTTWVNYCYTSDFAEQKHAPVKVKIEIDLTVDRHTATLLEMGVLSPSSPFSGIDPNTGEVSRADSTDIGTWLEGAKWKLRGAVVEKVRSTEIPEAVLLLAPPDMPIDPEDSSTRSLPLPPGGFLNGVFDLCGLFAREFAPGWTAHHVFAYTLFGDLPVLPTSIYEQYGAGKQVGDITLRFRFPVHGDKVLETFEDYVNNSNASPERRQFSPKAVSLSEHQLNLMTLVYHMPVGEFSWPDRLQVYLRSFSAGIDKGVSPDYGLSGKRDELPKEKWHNAARNLRRDYEIAIKKFA